MATHADTYASFCRLLSTSRLLSEAQKTELAKLAPRFAEPKELARELIRRDWVTAYQLQTLVQGKAKELQIGPYRVLNRIGEGGMGEVFKARHERLDRIVALKVIRKDRLSNPATVRRFYREIEAAAQLSHPNVVLAYDADQVGDSHYFAMEYVEGIDLARLVKEHGPLTIPQACECIRQAALGLQHAHEHGLVHRDIKPANLLMTRSSKPDARDAAAVVKVLDLGLARFQSALEETSTAASLLTQEGTVMGTPDYIAPEQAMSSHQVDIRADLYSLGCSLYFLLTGRPPFPGGSLMEKLMKHQMEQPTPVESLRPDLPPGLVAILNRLLAKQPEKRFQTPVELATALEPFTRPGSLTEQALDLPAFIPTPLAGDTSAAGQETAVPWLDDSTSSFTEFASLHRHLRKATGRPKWATTRVIVGIIAGSILALVTGIVVLSSLTGRSKEIDARPPSGGKPPPNAEASRVLKIEADRPWQDAHIEVQGTPGTPGKPVTIRAKGQWSMGPGTKPCSAAGDRSLPAGKQVLPAEPPMCLLVRIGDDPPIPVKEALTLYPRKNGRLYFQANDQALEDNSGSLIVEVLGGKPAAD